MSTSTLRELRHNFAVVEKAAQSGPVRITRKGRVIGIYKANREKKWSLPDFAGRAVKTKSSWVDVLDFIR
ncbi:MAG: hypothetical protein LBK99_12135 [Opitutaceae bacterium]|jgi:hypothetical protein|nr:hypothetical protein [Opitutaceae bacterium]